MKGDPTIKPLSQWIDEDAPANAAGLGGVAGIGVGPQGEPGIDLRKRRKDLDPLAEDAPMPVGDPAAADVPATTPPPSNPLKDHHEDVIKGLQAELGRTRFGLAKQPHSRTLKEKEASLLRKITRQQNLIAKTLDEAVSGRWQVRVRFAFGGEEIVATYDNQQAAERRAREYLGADAKGVWIVRPDGTEIVLQKPAGMNEGYNVLFRGTVDDLERKSKKVIKWTSGRPSATTRVQVVSRDDGEDDGDGYPHYVETDSSNPRELGIIREEVQPVGTFAGADVFEVQTDKLLASRFGKNRYHRYSRYVGEDETGEAIRQHGRTTKRDIVLKDGMTGAMVYLRRKK